MTNQALTRLAAYLTGPVFPPRSAVFKGGCTGVLLFFFVEYASVINSNLPRVPVAWLMIVAAIMIEAVLLTRILRLITRPRRPDLFFILGLSYQQRINTACTALRSGNRSFIPFTGTIMAVGIVGELLLLHEQSVVLLVILPAVCILLQLLAEYGMRGLLHRQSIHPSRSDQIDKQKTGAPSLFKTTLTRKSIPFARSLAAPFPGSIRIIVMHTFLHLMRAELLLTLLVTVGAPVVSGLCTALLPSHSAFASFIPLLFIFMSTMHYTAELSDAAEALTTCHWYRFSYRQLLAGYFLTLLLPILPHILFFAVFTASFAHPGLWLIRLVVFCIAVAVTLLISIRPLLLQNTPMAAYTAPISLFILVAIGNFIPGAGVLFSVVALLIVAWYDQQHLFPPK